MRRSRCPHCLLADLYAVRCETLRLQVEYLGRALAEADDMIEALSLQVADLERRLSVD